jgi:membrane glycosyltransferase
VNRLHLLFGIMGYVASPLWLLFLLLSSINVFGERSAGVSAVWVQSYTSVFGYRVEVPEALTLFAFTMFLLFVPKALSVMVTLRDRELTAAFGGPARLVVSALLESIVSALLAPINMVFNSRFVIFTLLGQGVTWVTQRRGLFGADRDWREAILTHAGQTVFGLVWGISAFILVPSFFWWLSPVLAGLVLSIPLSIILGNVGWGEGTQRAGIFLTPEESHPVYELRRLRQNLAGCYQHLRPIEPLRDDYGLLQAVLDPYVNAVHVSLLRQRRPSEESREYFMHLRQRLLREGPTGLTTKEKMALLLDADSLIWLHRELWRLPAGSLAGWWRLAMRQYNVLTATPVTALYR